MLNTRAKLGAIIFGCDGVLVDSERDGHRVALNKAIAEVSHAVSTIIVLCSCASQSAIACASKRAGAVDPGPQNQNPEP